MFQFICFQLRVTFDCTLVQAFVIELRGRSIKDYLNDYVQKKKKPSEHSKILTKFVLQMPLSPTRFPGRKGHV